MATKRRTIAYTPLIDGIDADRERESRQASALKPKSVTREASDKAHQAKTVAAEASPSVIVDSTPIEPVVVKRVNSAGSPPYDRDIGDAACLQPVPAADASPVVRMLYLRDDLRSLIVTGHDHPAYWPDQLPSAWGDLAGWPPPHTALRRLTATLYATVRRQVAAAWPTMDLATRIEVSDRLAEVDEFAEAMGWQSAME